MVEAESFVELDPMKDKFESSKPNGKGNGERNHEKDEEGHIDDGNNIDSTSGNRKPRDTKQRSNNPRDKGKIIKYFICQGPHMARKCPKKSMISSIKKKYEPKEDAKLIEGKTSRVNLMVLIPKKRNGEERLMFVDMNIAGQKRSALINTRASDLFISKKAVNKLGLSIKKSNKKIKIVNSEEALIVGVIRNVELQIGKWKGKEDFEVGTKVLSSIQLVKYILYGRNINSIERNTTKAPSKKLVEHETGMRPMELTMEPSPLGKVDCVLDFEGKEAMQKQSKRVNVAKVTMRALREWVGKDVMGQSAKPVTMAQNAPHGGLLIRWGTFSPRELSRFKELLEKPVRLKPGWPDNEDMTT
ncbi:hypothetical protein Gotri_011678 [Gossypium trilobum]|uniref:Uncharacterized protein n=1 Tax=Gossypium trilobum TaxID=34281 RepID=A0A7J9EUK1_9ROSI|nr:hypothetical protein [Gossypium trilobum]